MFYKPLREVLSDLDAQQRREFAALAGIVDSAELDRIRNARKQLSTVAVFFIEKSWEVIAPQLSASSLEMETGKSLAEIRAHLNRLHQRHPSYAWAWIRSRMNTRLMRKLEVCLPDLWRQYPKMETLYRHSLRQVDRYWFRESPAHHLKAGYHTALAVACKWYGVAGELQKSNPAECPQAGLQFHAELRLFASLSMNMLTRTDGYLWDSAGANPLEALLAEGALKIEERAIEEIDLRGAADYGLRLGCPALRARGEAEPPAFQGIITWTEQTFSRYLSDMKETPTG